MINGILHQMSADMCTVLLLALLLGGALYSFVPFYAGVVYGANNTCAEACKTHDTYRRSQFVCTCLDIAVEEVLP